MPSNQTGKVHHSQTYAWQGTSLISKHQACFPTFSSFMMNQMYSCTTYTASSGTIFLSRKRWEGEAIKWFTWLYGVLQLFVVFLQEYIDIERSSLETPAASGIESKCQIGISTTMTSGTFSSSIQREYFSPSCFTTLPQWRITMSGIPRNKIPVF